MSNEFQSIKQAISETKLADVYRWEELMADLWPALTKPLTAEGERLLLEIIRFEGRLQIDLSSEIPHSMPPEDMLKSLAIQSLARWTGLVHLREMKRVQLTTQSSSLSSLVRDVIENVCEIELTEMSLAGSEVGAENRLDAVIPVWSWPQEKKYMNAVSEVPTHNSNPKISLWPLQKDRGMSVQPGRRVRIRNQEPQLVY